MMEMTGDRPARGHARMANELAEEGSHCGACAI
jgi:hypothetical protein